MHLTCTRILNVPVYDYSDIVIGRMSDNQKINTKGIRSGDKSKDELEEIIKPTARNLEWELIPTDRVLGCWTEDLVKLLGI